MTRYNQAGFFVCMTDNIDDGVQIDVSKTSNVLEEYSKNGNADSDGERIFTLFAVDESNNVIGERAVIAEDRVLHIIKRMFEDEGVTHIEVHEGSCGY
jgi:hypothetical protein